MHSEVYGGELECHDRSSAMARAGATLYPFCGCVDRISTQNADRFCCRSLQRQHQHCRPLEAN